MFAVRKGDMRSVQALLAAGADVNEKRVDLATPLLVAIINGHEDLVDLLLDKGADPNAEGGSTDLSVPGIERAPDQDHAQDAVVSRSAARRRHRRRQRRQQQLGPAAAGGHARGQLAHQRRVHLRQHRSACASSSRSSSTAPTSTARNTDMEPRWSGARYRRRQVGLTPFLAAAKAGRHRSDAPAARERRRSEDEHRRSTSRR